MDIEQIDLRLLHIEQLLLCNKTVLTFDEVALYSGLSRSYLYKLTSAGLIPHSKPNGKNIYFEKAIVDTWLLRNKVKTHEEHEAAAVNYVTLKKKGGRS